VFGDTRFNSVDSTYVTKSGLHSHAATGKATGKWTDDPRNHLTQRWAWKATWETRQELLSVWWRSNGTGATDPSAFIRRPTPSTLLSISVDSTPRPILAPNWILAGPNQHTPDQLKKGKQRRAAGDTKPTACGATSQAIPTSILQVVALTFGLPSFPYLSFFDIANLQLVLYHSSTEHTT
jgi:hypothetical protein